MSRIGLLLVLLLLGRAVADERPADEPPRGPEVEAADKVLAAITAKDEAALAALAASDEPDPWIVADELCRRGEYGAASAFALAAPRPDVEALPAYIASRRGTSDDKALRERFVAVRTQRHAGPDELLEALGPVPAVPIESVVGVRLVLSRASVLDSLSRWKESLVAWAAVAESAEALGWLGCAAEAYGTGGVAAYTAGDRDAALAAWQRGLAVAERIRDRGHLANLLHNLVVLSTELGRHAEAISFLRRLHANESAMGDEAGAARTLVRIAGVVRTLGEPHDAITAHERAAAALEKVGDARLLVDVLMSLGAVHQSIEDRPEALAAFERAVAVGEKLGDKVLLSKILNDTGLLQIQLGDPVKALALLERSIELKEAAGDAEGAESTRGNLGSVYSALGEHEKALAFMQRALQAAERGDRKLGIATTLNNMGNLYRELGEHAKALSLLERSREAHLAAGNEVGAAQTLHGIGATYEAVGDYPTALRLLESSRAALDALGQKQGAAHVLGTISGIHAALGENDKALASYGIVLAEMEKLGDRRGVAVTQARISGVYLALGELQKALVNAERSLETMRALDLKSDIASVLSHAAQAHRALGDRVKARRYLEESRDLAESLRALPILADAQTNLAELHLEMGKPSRALSAAREGLGAMETLVGGLGGGLGVTARAMHADLFAVGTLAAIGDEDLGQALKFLESGRAGALLDMLGKREMLRWKAESLSPELRRRDLEAQAAQGAAQATYDTAARRGDLKAMRAAGKALDGANDAVRAVADRIQSDLTQQAGLFYPRAKTLGEVRSSLAEGQALVLYGLCRDEAVALVVRRDDERVVALGKLAVLLAACEALDATDVASDPTATLAKIRSLLVDPLKLGKDVEQVLISPEGPLCYLPFAALFERTVALTPSGTTHVLLRSEERAPGEGVLALGDPDYGGVSQSAQAIYYRGRSLSPLPESRKEAASVGSKVLLGADASEEGLFQSLSASKRWRSVHFACHGLVNVEKPMLSSLALSRAGGGDGFLTALEILREEIPADLVVLSACETAKGRIVQGEGIVGMTRAFMFAGSPRVICSLWKVDDEATRALMIKFYELWNPKSGKGLGTAEALRQAQAHVRAQAKWKHPYYWAAWVLWGLPD